MIAMGYIVPVWQVLLIIQVLVSLLPSCQCSPQNCSVIYSSVNFRGKTFILQDFDQSVNTRKDYRGSIFGWEISGSAIRVQPGCRMNICNDTYFLGACQTLAEGDHFSEHFLNPILSTNCTCTRECNCADIIIPKHRYGRAYLQGGCGNCFSEYLELSADDWDFPAEYKDSITSLVLRKGCNLTTYSEAWRYGVKTEITKRIIENYEGSIGSYEIRCDGDNAIKSSSVSTTTSAKAYPQMIDLPKTDDELFHIIAANKTLANHPGILAAVQSLENGRVARNAYILMIGTGSLLNLDMCTQYLSTINECHIPVDLPELGIRNAQLRVIYAEAIANHDELYEDYCWMASLDEYLSNHEELRDHIPNAVIIRHFLDDDDSGKSGSLFQRKLNALSLLRTQILDENYSNVLFLFRTRHEPRNPQIQLEKFEKAIMTNWSFPLPNHLIPYNIDYWNEKKVKVNGNWRMKDGEYFPRNAHEELTLICEKGGDPLGYAILRTAFQDSFDFDNVSVTQQEIVARRFWKVDKYGELSENPFSQKNLYKNLQEEKAMRRKMHFTIVSSLEAQVKIEELQRNLKVAKQKQWKSDQKVQNLQHQLLNIDKLIDEKLEKALQAQMHVQNSSSFILPK